MWGLYLALFIRGEKQNNKKKRGGGGGREKDHRSGFQHWSSQLGVSGLQQRSSRSSSFLFLPFSFSLFSFLPPFGHLPPPYIFLLQCGPPLIWISLSCYVNEDACSLQPSGGGASLGLELSRWSWSPPAAFTFPLVLASPLLGQSSSLCQANPSYQSLAPLQGSFAFASVWDIPRSGSGGLHPLFPCRVSSPAIVHILLSKHLFVPGGYKLTLVLDCLFFQLVSYRWFTRYDTWLAKEM